ncbi:hypothetical protein ACFV23_33535, partial [Streptomyces sp. NPDC059627]
SVGAAALGRTDIGALRPGNWADMVHVSVDGPQFATGVDVEDERLLANLMWAAGSRAVRDVWVAGEQVVADGETVRADRTAAQRGPPPPAGPRGTARSPPSRGRTAPPRPGPPGHPLRAVGGCVGVGLVGADPQ